MIDADYILRNLPTALSPKEEAELWERYSGEVGGDWLIFERKSVTYTPKLSRTMDAEAWERFERGKKKAWVAWCRCTCCGEDFFGGYIRGGKGKSARQGPGISLCQGEDGSIYPDELTGGCPEIDADGRTAFFAGDQIECPYCGDTLTVLPKRNVGNGKTFRNLAMETRRIGRYTVLLFWQLRKTLLSNGTCDRETTARHAVVIGDRGELHTFRKTEGGGGLRSERALDAWKENSHAVDPTTRIYYSADGICGKMIGGSILRERATVTAGETGEKTALADYLNAGGRWPVKYLQILRKWPSLEALMKSEFGRFVVSEIDQRMNQKIQLSMREIEKGLSFADLRYKRPHEMLGMSREEFQAAKGWRLDTEKLRAWRRYRDAREEAEDGTGLSQDTVCAEEFFGILQDFGGDEIARLAIRHGYSVRQLARYLKGRRRFQSPREALFYLKDYWADLFVDAAAGHRADDRPVFPTDLFAAHEDMIARKQMEEDRKWQDGFDRMLALYGKTEQTDGRYCVRLPRCISDLEEEGRVLRHCVGGYGAQHASGKHIIFFVRKYRTPERSYYTLEIGFRDGIPFIEQLHGYGNERHGEHKQFTHTIPQSVREFCAWWLRDVFTPCYREMIAAGQKQQKQKKTKTETRRTA